jgi:hypothetical protein
MNRQHLTIGLTTLLIALMGLSLAWSQPEGDVQQVSADAEVQRAELALQTAMADIRIAEANGGQTRDATLWSQIGENRDLMTAAQASGEWGAVITRAQRIRADVLVLLSALHGEAHGCFQQVRAAMFQLETLGSADHVPLMVDECRALMSSLLLQIAERQYLQAIDTAHEALVRIDETVVATRRSQANRGITEIDNIITRIVNADGDRRMPERFRVLSEQFEEVIGLFFNSEFDEAFPRIDELRPMAEQMLRDLQEPSLL